MVMCAAARAVDLSKERVERLSENIRSISVGSISCLQKSSFVVTRACKSTRHMTTTMNCTSNGNIISYIVVQIYLAVEAEQHSN